MLTLRYGHNNDVGLAPNVIICYNMLLATKEFENRHFCTKVTPCTVGLFASSEIVYYRSAYGGGSNWLTLAPNVIKYYEMLLAIDE